MGMVGEFLAASNAKRLEKILTKIVDSNDPLENKTDENPINMDLIDWYLSECEEGFVAPNYSLIKRFEKHG